MGNSNAKQDRKADKASTKSDNSDKSDECKPFREVQGRKFHNEDETTTKYPFPFDLEEQDRLTIQHYALRYAWQSNFSAPVHELLSVCTDEDQTRSKVLDVGCGTGIWSFEMASEYPRANFYGIDIAPAFPQEIRPSNVAFQLANVIDGIPFPDETFDYVFMRFMCISFTEKQWRENAIKEILRVTKVGGYVEIFDFDATFTAEGPNIEKIISASQEYLKQRDINPHIVPEIPKMLAETGQLRLPINIERLDLPVGKWAGELGRMMHQTLIQGMETGKVFLPSFMGISVEEYEKTLKEASAEFETVKPSLPSGRAYAQKITSTGTG